MSNKDLMSRDYDLRQVQDDPRLAQCRKEFWALFIIIAITLVAIMVVCFGINWGPVSEYTYICGFPAWMALGTLIAVVGTAVCIFYMLKFVKDVPLDDIQSDEEVKDA